MSRSPHFARLLNGSMVTDEPSHSFLREAETGITKSCDNILQSTGVIRPTAASTHSLDGHRYSPVEAAVNFRPASFFHHRTPDELLHSPPSVTREKREESRQGHWNHYDAGYRVVIYRSETELLPQQSLRPVPR